MIMQNVTHIFNQILCMLGYYNFCNIFHAQQTVKKVHFPSTLFTGSLKGDRIIVEYLLKRNTTSSDTEQRPDNKADPNRISTTSPVLDHCVETGLYWF